MLTRKFGDQGPYIYEDQQINMYALGVWLSHYNLRLSQVTKEHIKQFLAETNNDTINYNKLSTFGQTT